MSIVRKPILAGNWKMHGLRAEAEALARGIAAGCGDLSDREVLLGPTFTALDVVARTVAGSGIGVAGQNLYFESKGAFTGEITAEMLRDVGCSHVIVGHSERRQWFGETDSSVARKVVAARAAGLVPIVCIGETLDEREAGSTLSVVERQLREGLPGLDADAIGALVVAYEPVWAIGTGKVATPAQAQEVHAFLRRTLADMASVAAAERCRILYGGSVKPENIDELMKQTDIDGALVGGASLSVESFLRIVRFV